jgi:stearoyl-CoA desaturase (Delta-9 desaturase)
MTAQASQHDDILYPDIIPFLLVHLSGLAVLWTGITAETAALAVGLYLARMFGITAGYHRYFSHRTFRTGRVFQFVLALLAQSSAQRGILWWAAKHRWHHKHADTELDVHSPVKSGFLRAHVGWIFSAQHHDTDLAAVSDLTRYPELLWLNRHPYLPAALLALLVWLVAGWPGLVVSFCWSTIATWHATFCINSLAHVMGRKRYVTGDESRNNWFLAILTLGEGWHNNHHAYQSSVRQGFRWWEYDPTYYVLKLLSRFGIVWDLHMPPEAVTRGEQRLGRKVIERVSHQLAASFPIERVAAEARKALAHTPVWAELQVRARTARSQAEALLADIRLPHVPDLEEIRHLAQTRLAKTPSLDDIVNRTRQLLLEKVSAELIAQAATSVGS